MAREGRRRRGEPAPGVAVPGHRIGPPVGFGAHGAVWSARDDAGRDVAVSILALPPGAAGTTAMRRLAALRGGSHPHLASVVDVVGLDQHRCALVSELVPGPTLATVRAAREPLNLAELATLLGALGSALGHLHERGVVHGDVSPANVVLAPAGVPVLVDLAGEVARELGTPGFVAPERALGAAAGAAGDVWALARLLLWAGPPEPDGRLLAALGPALDADPRRRPHARDLASLAPALAGREPVRVPAAPELAQARLRMPDAPTRVRPAFRREVVADARREQDRPGRRARTDRDGSAAGRVRGRPRGDSRPRSDSKLRGDGGPRSDSKSRGDGGPRRDSGPQGESRARARGDGGDRQPERPVVVPPRRREERQATRRGAHRRPRQGLRAHRGAPGAVGDRSRPSARTRRPWGAVAAVTGALVAAAAVAVAIVLMNVEAGHAGPGRATTGPVASLRDAGGTVAALLDRRADALEERDASALAAVTVPGSPSAAEDDALLARLVGSGTQVLGLDTDVLEVRAVAARPGNAVVEAVLQQRDHARVVAGERVDVPAQPARCVRLELHGPGPWRLAATEPCA